MNVVARAVLIVLGMSLTAASAQEKLGPFTESPRSVRQRDYDVLHVRLELDFDCAQETVDGRAVTRLTPFGQTSRIEFDAADMQILGIRLLPDGSTDTAAQAQTLEHETLPESLVVHLPREYTSAEELTLAVDYRLDHPEKGVFFVNPDTSEPDQAPMIWTHNEPIDARYWFPTLDAPNERFTSEVLVTVPDSFFVLSNGVLRETRSLDDGRKSWHWVQEQSHVPYLVSVVAGEFEAYEQEFKGIPIVSYVPTGRLDDAPRSFAQTPEMMDLFARLIGYRYPWPKYTQICVDEYIAGGMEHTSATTLTLRTLHDERAELDVSSENLVAHELAHQWFGDLITCKDWAELWLNESFATYFGTLWQEHDEGWDEASWTREREAQSYFNEDANRYRRPIVSYRYDAPMRMFDRHSYPKGARVLHMLRFELGDDAFWDAVRLYCQQNEYGVVETADLRSAIEQATGRSMNWFFNQWIHHGGHPKFEVSYAWNPDTSSVDLTVKQTQKVTDLTPLFRVTVEVDLVTDSDTQRRRIVVSEAEETFHFELPQRPRRVVFDPRDWVLKKLEFTKSTQEWIDQLLHDPHVMARARAAQQLGELRPDTDARDALVSSAADDEFRGVRQRAVEALARFSGEVPRAALIAAARSDASSHVRRAAIDALEDFPDKATSACLRHVIANDPSYYAIAEALRSLAELEREDARDDLIAAIDVDSHNQVVLQAACDGLVDIEDASAAEHLRRLIEPENVPGRRAAAFSALARLGLGDPEITKLLAQELDERRPSLRQAAATALGETGDLSAIDALLARRDRETSGRVLRAIDDAVTKLRDTSSVDSLRKEIGELRKANQELEQRVSELEENKGG